jgi:hypothetical protein
MAKHSKSPFYRSKESAWVNSIVEREMNANPKKYSNGSFGFGAYMTVADRLKKSIKTCTDPKKKKFLINAYNEAIKTFE